MKRILYLTANGRLHRKGSTIYYFTTEGRRIVPVEQVKAIIAVGRVSITSGVVSFLAKQGIPLHYFGFYGNYEGTFYPRRKLVSGFALVSQAKAHLDSRTRLNIAQSIVESCTQNMLVLLRYHSAEDDDIAAHTKLISEASGSARTSTDVPELMSIEGRAWTHYYSAVDLAIDDFTMGTREKRPPNNPVNALISFGNSLLYSAILTQIYHTQLDPSISFLHEPSERRFSLALDLAEIFKPPIVGGLILRLLNLKMLRIEHFDQRVRYCTLTDEGRRIFLSAFDDALRKTAKHPRLKRSVSNEYLLRLECYKLMKHVAEGKRYTPFLASRGY
jgi:CRISPR-associated protein Cas1